jgi:hypothetical protein
MSEPAIPVKKRRDLAIDAAVRRLVISEHPELAECEIQARGAVEVAEGSGFYVVEFDGKPLVRVTLEGDNEFRLTILQTTHG